MTENQIIIHTINSLGEAATAYKVGFYWQAENSLKAAFENLNNYYRVHGTKVQEVLKDFLNLGWTIYEEAKEAVRTGRGPNTVNPNTKFSIDEEDLLNIHKQSLDLLKSRKGALIDAAALCIDTTDIAFDMADFAASVERAKELIDLAFTNPKISEEELTRGYHLLAKIHWMPYCNIVDPKAANEFAQKALEHFTKASKLTPKERFEIYYNILKTMLFLPENFEKVQTLTNELLYNGFDKNIISPLLGFLHHKDPKKAAKIEKELYKEKTPLGIFLHGQDLLLKCFNSQSDKDFQSLKNFTYKVLVKEQKKNDGTAIGDDILGLIVYVCFINKGPDLLEDPMIFNLVKVADNNSLWASLYLAKMYDWAAELIAEEKPYDFRVSDYQELALRYYARAANLGHRGGFTGYIQALKDYGNDPDTLALYEEYAKRLNISLD